MPVSRISWFTRWSRSDEPGDFLQQGFVLRREDAQVAADVVDVVLQQEDARGVAAAMGFKLVKVEPLQQFAVDAQLQFGHDRAEVGLQFGAGDGRRPLGFEVERVGPDADFRARLEDGRLSAEHLLVADNATVQSHVLQVQLAVGRPHHGVPPRDQRTLQAYGVGRVTADRDLRIVHFDQGAAAFVDFVVPDFHRR